MKNTIKRNDNYRREYLRKHKGIKGYYMCSYCGKIIKKENMEVDHVIPIAYAQKHRWARKLYRKKDINHNTNLTPACHYCNSKKKANGGLWIIKGKIGFIVQPVLWIVWVIFVIYIGKIFLENELYIYLFNEIEPVLKRTLDVVKEIVKNKKGV